MHACLQRRTAPGQPGACVAHSAVPHRRALQDKYLAIKEERRELEGSDAMEVS